MTPLPTDIQAIFDESVTKLAAQGHKSMSRMMCNYHQIDTGYKCAIGIILPEDRMPPSNCTETISVLIDSGCFPEWKNERHRSFIRKLQKAHDYASVNGDKSFKTVHSPDGIAFRMREVATEFKLNTDALDKAWPKEVQS